MSQRCSQFSEQHEHVHMYFELAPGQASQPAWYAQSECIHQAKAQLCANKLPGEVHSLEALTLITVPRGTHLSLHDANGHGTFCHVDNTAGILPASPTVVNSLLHTPQHSQMAKRAGRGIQTKAQSGRAFLGYMGMVGYRAIYHRVGTYFQLPCGPSCTTPCLWRERIAKIIRAVDNRRHMWSVPVDFRMAPHRKMAPQLCITANSPACAISMDFWAEAHTDKDADLLQAHAHLHEAHDDLAHASHYTLNSCFCTVNFGEVIQYFVFPDYRIAVQMQHEQLVRFNSHIKHCAAWPNRQEGAHTCGVVPILKDIHISPHALNMHQTPGPRSLLMLPVSASTSTVGARQMHDLNVE